MAIANLLGIDALYQGSQNEAGNASDAKQGDLFGLGSNSTTSNKSGFSPLVGGSAGGNGRGINEAEKSNIMSPTMPSLLTQAVVDNGSQTDTLVHECITLVINGMQLMRVRLPKHEPGATAKGTMHVIPSTLKARVDGASHDSRHTPVSLLVSGMNMALPRDNCVKLFVRFTGEGHQHDIQFKDLYTRMDSDLVTETITFVPTHVTLHLKYHATCVVRDEEQEVLEALREIIADEKVNPRGGSITSALANDILKEKHPNLYEIVIKGNHGNLENFLNAHQDVFTLFTFSNKALKKKTVSPEPRIVLKAGQRELCTNLPMSQAEVRLHEHLLEVLGNKDLDKRDLLDQLSNDMTFATFLSPTLSILMRFLSRHKDRFVWSMDPDKPTVVGLQGRQHDSVCLGHQADLDKLITVPANKKWNNKEKEEGGNGGNNERAPQMQREQFEGGKQHGGGKGERGGGKGKGQKGQGRGRGGKGDNMGGNDAWASGKGGNGANAGGGGYNAMHSQRDQFNQNAGAGYILNGAQQVQGMQVLNGNQLQYQYQQIPQQGQFQQIVMPQQQFIYDNQIKVPVVQQQTDDMSVLDMIGNNTENMDLYRSNSGQGDIVGTPEGSFVFLEQGQERPAPMAAPAAANSGDGQTVFLHEVRFVNGNAGQVSPAQQPLLMQTPAPLFAQPGRLAQSALPFGSQMVQPNNGGGVGT